MKKINLRPLTKSLGVTPTAIRHRVNVVLTNVSWWSGYNCIDLDTIVLIFMLYDTKLHYNLVK